MKRIAFIDDCFLDTEVVEWNKKPDMDRIMRLGTNQGIIRMLKELGFGIDIYLHLSKKTIENLLETCKDYSYLITHFPYDKGYVNQYIELNNRPNKEALKRFEQEYKYGMYTRSAEALLFFRENSPRTNIALYTGAHANSFDQELCKKLGIFAFFDKNETEPEDIFNAIETIEEYNQEE